MKLEVKHNAILRLFVLSERQKMPYKHTRNAVLEDVTYGALFQVGFFSLGHPSRNNKEVETGVFSSGIQAKLELSITMQIKLED